MLVTVFLIQTGIYGTIDAPTSRGLGFLEIWYIGMQVPIMVAIIEYGFVLIIMKYKGLENEVKIGDKSIKLDKLMKIIDLLSFFGCLAFCISFKIYYLILCFKELNQ